MQQMKPRPLIANAPRYAADPAPSVWSYKLQRLWLTPRFRTILRYGFPVFVVLFVSLTFFSRQENIDYFGGLVEDAQTSVRSRPEHMVNAVAVDGASPLLWAEIRADMDAVVPISALELDLDQLRFALESLPAVDQAILRIKDGGVLSIEVQEIAPDFVWRTHSGLNLLSADGEVLRQIATRTEFPDLPLIAGLGADQHLDEAGAILHAALPLAAQIRGLVRIGERRWDLVLLNDQRVMLPDLNAPQAMHQVAALSAAQDILARDIAVVDMRNPRRPTLRMRPDAVAQLRAAKLSSSLETSE